MARKTFKTEGAAITHARKCGIPNAVKNFARATQETETGLWVGVIVLRRDQKAFCETRVREWGCVPAYPSEGAS